MRAFALITAAFLFSSTAYAGVPKTVTLDVQNMTCDLCAVTVKKALEHTPGVSSARIDADKKTALVTYDPDAAGVASLVKSTTNASYPSTARTAQ